MSVPEVPSRSPSIGAAGGTDAIARFTGGGSDYFRLLVRGNVLVAVTLGIYRFWLSNDMRRFLWSNTEIGGESLEYTGRGIELFLGFLIGIAVLLPLYVVFAVVPLMIPGFKEEGASSLLFLLLLLLGQFAIYRARRYRLTRTVFRGVRLHQTGSAWGYAFRSAGWWILIFWTLGLAYPWAEANLERYKMRNTFYGDLPGHFAGTGSALFTRGIVLWLIVVGPILAILLVAPFANWSAVDAALSTQKVTHTNIAGVISVAAVMWVVIAALALYPAFQALTMRWWLAGIRFGKIEVASSLRTAEVYRIWLRFLVYAVLLGVAAAVVSSVLLGAIIGSMSGLGSISTITVSGPATPHIPLLAQVAGTGIALLVYVTVVLCYSVLYQLVVKLALWRAAVSSLDVANFQMIELVKAEGQQSSPFGEGLADALNVGSF
jgi:uncharacterized membrane protein YjgN (DUF898 family)